MVYAIVSVSTEDTAVKKTDFLVVNELVFKPRITVVYTMIM